MRKLDVEEFMSNLFTGDIIYTTDFFNIFPDSHPVSPGHMLIVAKSKAIDFYQLSNYEQNDIAPTLLLAKQIIQVTFNPDGYNIGMNCGRAAGQSIDIFHCHVIPRYIGDMKNPAGGVRGVIPWKQQYET